MNQHFVFHRNKRRVLRRPCDGKTSDGEIYRTLHLGKFRQIFVERVVKANAFLFDKLHNANHSDDFAGGINVVQIPVGYRYNAVVVAVADHAAIDCVVLFCDFNIQPVYTIALFQRIQVRRQLGKIHCDRSFPLLEK